MAFFELLNTISIFECYDDLHVWYQMKAYMWENMKTKHTYESKAYKHTQIICFCIPNVHYRPERLFSLNWHFLFLGTNFPKKGILGGKSEKWISSLNSAYWSNLGTKFSLNWQIWFLYQLTQKGYFRSKTENSQFCVRRWSLLTILTFSTR